MNRLLASVFRIKHLFAITLFSSLAVVSNAMPIIDTGEGNGPQYLLNHQQWLGAQFNVHQETRIEEISGFMGTVAAGSVSFAIYDGAGNLPGTQLFSADITLGLSDPQWATISGLDWLIGSGTYWVVFRTLDQTYRGVMPGLSPFQLGNEAHTGVLPDVWFDSNDDNHGLSVRIQGTQSIVSVPEPSTIYLLGAGLLFLVSRRSQRANSRSFLR
jgi:hypothetical protein